jgi:tRNA nucleotidyltransferase (CCA-adding enzyme)
LKIYLVGGAVRDELLGRPVGDRDWVVVGGSAEALIQAGFTPVGKDFPVFLHPQTHEQYALARTERKVAKGYAGFQFFADPSVTLQDDLARRDLTINAMARDPDGALIDPFHGQSDLQARCFRHVSAAFAEDPVRILRLARFAAQFTDFTTHPDTLRLMAQMVSSGEVDALVPERVWQEVSRGMEQVAPSRMWHELRACGALARIAPELASLDAPAWQRAMQRIDAVDPATPALLAVRWALLCADLPVQQKNTWALRWRVPGECVEIAAMADLPLQAMAGSDWQATHSFELIKRADGLRRAERFATAVDVWSRLHGLPASQLLSAAQAARAVQAAPVIAELPANKSAQDIASALDRARERAVQQVLLDWRPAAPQK